MNLIINAIAFPRLFLIRIAIAVSLVHGLILYETVLVKAENTGGEYYNSGNRKISAGDYQGAIEDFNKAITLDPNYVYSYIYRGVARYELGDYKQSISDFNKAIEIEPAEEVAYYHRGIARMKLGDYGQAILDFNKSIQIKPTWRTFSERGFVKEKLGDYTGAIQDYNKAIEVVSSELEKKDSLEAAREVDTFLYAITLNSRGTAKAKLSDYRGALMDFNKAIELIPTVTALSKDAFYNRGVVKIILGQKDSGCLDLSKAGELGFEKAYQIIKEYCNP